MVSNFVVGVAGVFTDTAMCSIFKTILIHLHLSVLVHLIVIPSFCVV